MNETGEREKRMPETTGDLGPAGFLLPEGRITTVRPRDFVLGPLALGQPGSPGSATSQKDATPSRQEELAISELVRSFFTADSFELQYIAPEEKKRLQWTLGNRWRPVEKVRLAPPEQLEDGRWRLRVRLLSSGGDAVGEVYVEEEKANWYITEVAIDFSELDTSGPDRRFEPGNVRASGGL